MRRIRLHPGVAGLFLLLPSCAVFQESSASDAIDGSAQARLPEGCREYEPASPSDYPSELWYGSYDAVYVYNPGYTNRVRRAATVFSEEVWAKVDSLDTDQFEHALKNAFCNYASADQMILKNWEGFPFRYKLRMLPEFPTAEGDDEPVTPKTDRTVKQWEALRSAFVSDNRRFELGLSTPVSVPHDAETLRVTKDIDQPPNSPYVETELDGSFVAYDSLKPDRHLAFATTRMIELVRQVEALSQQPREFPRFSGDYEIEAVRRYADAYNTAVRQYVEQADRLLSEMAYISANWFPFGHLAGNWGVLYVLLAQARIRLFPEELRFPDNRLPGRIGLPVTTRPSTGLDLLMIYAAHTYEDAFKLYRFWASGAFDSFFYSEQGAPLRRYGAHLSWTPSVTARHVWQRFSESAKRALEAIVVLTESNLVVGSQQGNDEDQSLLNEVRNDAMLNFVLTPWLRFSEGATTSDERDVACLMLLNTRELLAEFLAHYARLLDEIDTQLSAAVPDQAPTLTAQRGFISHMFRTALTYYDLQAKNAIESLMARPTACYEAIAAYRYFQSNEVR